MVDIEDIFNRSKHVDRGVLLRYHGTVLHVRSDDVPGRPVRIDVVCTVLGIIFQNEDQGIGFVGAIGHFFDEFGDRIIVVSLLDLRSVNAVKRRSERAHVVLHEADRRECREVTFLHVTVKFPFPFFLPPEVGEAGVKATKIRISVVEECNPRRKANSKLIREWIPLERRCLTIRQEILRLIAMIAIISESLTCAGDRIPNVAFLNIIVAGPIDCSHVGCPRQNVWIGRADRDQFQT